MDTILVFGCNCQKWLIFRFFYRLSLLNFDLNGAAEPLAVRGPTGKRGRPAGKRGPFGGRARPVGVARRWTKALLAGWRQHGPAVDQGFAGGAAPTWVGAGRDSGCPVGVARRWIKALPAGRRQHGPAPGGIRGALLAWPDGGIRGCRRGGTNMGRRRAGFGAPCWRGPTVN